VQVDASEERQELALAMRGSRVRAFGPANGAQPGAAASGTPGGMRSELQRNWRRVPVDQVHRLAETLSRHAEGALRMNLVSIFITAALPSKEKAALGGEKDVDDSDADTDADAESKGEEEGEEGEDGEEGEESAMHVASPRASTRDRRPVDRTGDQGVSTHPPPKDTDPVSLALIAHKGQSISEEVLINVEAAFTEQQVRVLCAMCHVPSLPTYPFAFSSSSGSLVTCLGSCFLCFVSVCHVSCVMFREILRCVHRLELLSVYIAHLTSDCSTPPRLVLPLGKRR
jgi:hypothetical protein